MQMENWDGARIRFHVEKRPGAQAWAGGSWRVEFFPSQLTQMNLLMDPKYARLWKNYRRLEVQAGGQAHGRGEAVY